jgi:hypothetical protein
MPWRWPLGQGTRCDSRHHREVGAKVIHSIAGGGEHDRLQCADNLGVCGKSGCEAGALSGLKMRTAGACGAECGGIGETYVTLFSR